MKCDEDIVKCLVFWTNFILALVGITLISIGIVYKISLEELLTAIPNEYNNLTVIPILTIPLGTSLILLAVFGCYGCLTERIKCVVLYIAILLLLFVIQLTIGINAFYKLGNQDTFKNELEVKLEDIFKNHNNFKSLINLIQHRLKCCGYDGVTYWSNSVPKSCYKTNSKVIYEKLCKNEMFNYIIYCQHVLGITISSLSIAEIIASVVSLLFVHYLKYISKDFVCLKDYTFDLNEVT